MPQVMVGVMVGVPWLRSAILVLDPINRLQLKQADVVCGLVFLEQF